MKFNPFLYPGRLIRRYKRFLADICLDSGETITAHCANPGALLGLTTTGIRVWVAHNPSPTRRLAYDWYIGEENSEKGSLVGVHTQVPNRLMEEAYRTRQVDHLGDQDRSLLAYTDVQREVPYGQQSRVDFRLTAEGLPPCYVEVKNVHYKVGEGAFFPDSVTRRGQKHVTELMAVAKEGVRAVMVYVVQRSDVHFLSFAKEIDPVYARLVAQAVGDGLLEVYSYTCTVTPQEIQLHSSLPVLFDL